ncbi:hypothetical protein RE476_02980 [Methanolobus mangrovi]|uniref:Uncharacterized protein n=1 Tax=Methanolobus mangrovi TaxID=3072977 RepID=A0AA51YK40_9EURY|nr:hypothetical protein [Methanolobus mangrovi]WMW22804.1 hypothetical protein RE476_02980 [Methanolobus mangrovi]
MIISLSSGCLETPQATPAAINENALLAYGWSQVSIEENSFEQTITDSTSIALNSTTVKYHNDRLSEDISKQVSDFEESNNLPLSISIPENLSAQIITYRLSLPSGAKLPTGLVSRIMETMIDEIKDDGEVENLQETTTRNLTLADGTETMVKIFSAAGNSTDSGMRMLGFVTAFENEDTSTIIMGLVPDGEYRIEVWPINDTLFSIDGESELDEMLELVSTIE